MNRYTLSLFLALAATTSLHAQPAPFDMSPERPLQSEGETLAAPRAPEPLPLASPDQPQQAEFRRRLLPAGDVMLRGETASKGWALNLTKAQAEAPMRLQLAYSNAIVVAPEASRLQLLINDSPVIDTPVRSADGVANIQVDIPAGLLRAGRNEISLRARQRHRTDCTIESTYELWSAINAAQTFISSSDPSAAKLTTVEDLRTISADGTGRATIAIVAPGMSQSDISADVLRLAQAIALHLPLPDLDFVIDSAPSPEQEDASLRVFFGTHDEIEALGVRVPSSSTGPVAAFAEGQASVPSFVVSGRNRSEWLSALDEVLAPIDRAAGTRRDTVITEAWHLPNAPMVYGGRELTFRELGIRSESFSGRSFSTSFQFAVPSDFYADSYGEAQILLDAGYAANVLPGSLINVYVNGSIAVSMPLNDQRGAILEQLPLRMTMRHFKPGLNEVTIVANLQTAEDEACTAVGLSDETPRLAIFNSSRFVIPDFARIGQHPNLAALGGTGFPYTRLTEPLPIYLERNDAATLSVAADLMARVALSAGRSVPVTLTNSPDALRDRDAIFISSVNAIPAPVFSQVKLSEEARTFWVASHGGVPVEGDATQADAELWRQQIGQGAWLDNIGQWFERKFELSLSQLRFAPGSEKPFVPSQPAQLLVAQGVNPAGSGVWTLFTAPDAMMLTDGVSAITKLPNWSRLSGRLATLDSDEQTINALPAKEQSLVLTRPLTLNNFRLIIANWLSTNILSYSVLLIFACILLGIATSSLLTRVGRRR